MIDLPRQARDGHRETLKEEALSAGVRVEDCEISGHGQHGVVMNGTYSGVHGSSIHSVGCSGVRVAGGVGRTLEAGEMFVTHNRISNFSLVKRSYVPVRKRNETKRRVLSILFCFFLDSGLFLFPVNCSISGKCFRSGRLDSGKPWLRSQRVSFRFLRGSSGRALGTITLITSLQTARTTASSVSHCDFN